MNNATDLKIEQYLYKLDFNLAGMSVGQRAEIITEIKSHIRETMERDPARTIDTVLADLGAPESVAERYLVSKGISPVKPNKVGPLFKWLMVCAAIFCFMVVAAGVAVIWTVNSVVKVDGRNERVSLFNGLIDVDGKGGRVKIGSLDLEDLKDENRFHIKGVSTTENVKLIKIPFNTAALEVRSTDDKEVRWDCHGAGTGKTVNGAVKAGVFTLDLENIPLAECEIALPAGIASQFSGVNGAMEVKRPQNPMEISMNNGNVNIQRDQSRVYDFEIKVKNGKQDEFPRSSDKSALKMKVNIANGAVNDK